MNKENSYIYGASDDLIELDGAIYGEHGSNGYAKLSCSDGTEITATYCTNGEWEIEINNAGSQFTHVVKSVGEDNNHSGEVEGCTSYSDVAVFIGKLDWVKANGNIID